MSEERMKEASDDEQEHDFMEANRAGQNPGKSRSERAEQLRKMMDDDGKTKPNVPSFA